MSINPYEAPPIQDDPRHTSNEARVKALRRLRIALLILLVPAIYNFICFNFPSNANRIELPIHNFYRGINFGGLVLIVLTIWNIGLVILEFVAGGIHAIVARHSRLDNWKSSLYTTLLRAPLFSIAGAALWALWVAAFYQLRLDFYVVSVPIGIAAHLLAAFLYVPLFYQWYKLERSAARSVTT